MEEKLEQLKRVLEDMVCDAQADSLNLQDKNPQDVVTRKYHDGVASGLQRAINAIDFIDYLKTNAERKLG